MFFLKIIQLVDYANYLNKNNTSYSVTSSGVWMGDDVAARMSIIFILPASHRQHPQNI